MIEAQRLAYLEAMGVDSYMPRRLLTLAPEPLLCDTLAEVVAEVVPEQAEAGSAAPSGDALVSAPQTASAENAAVAPAPVAPQQRERPPIEWGDEPEAGKAKQPAAQSGRGNAKAFKLRASIAVSDQGWLIADASPAPLSASQMMPWSAQLLRALSGQPGQSRYSVFNWPPPRTQSLAVTEAEANESFAALLTGAVERDQVRCVLLLGETWREWTLPPEVQVVRGPSIAEMRQDPKAKALLWQSMRRFKHALA